MWGGQSCPQPAFSRRDPLESGSAAKIGCPTFIHTAARDSIDQSSSSFSGGFTGGVKPDAVQVKLRFARETVPSHLVPVCLFNSAKRSLPRAFMSSTNASCVLSSTSM